MTKEEFLKLIAENADAVQFANQLFTDADKSKNVDTLERDKQLLQEQLDNALGAKSDAVKSRDEFKTKLRAIESELETLKKNAETPEDVQKLVDEKNELIKNHALEIEKIKNESVAKVDAIAKEKILTDIKAEYGKKFDLTDPATAFYVDAQLDKRIIKVGDEWGAGKQVGEVMVKEKDYKQVAEEFFNSEEMQSKKISSTQSGVPSSGGGGNQSTSLTPEQMDEEIMKKYDK